MNDTEKTPKKRMRKAGDPDRKACVLEALKLGLPMRMAARAGGMSREACRQWRKKDEQFADECESAIAAGVACLLKTIHLAAPQNWQAAAWILERRFPQDFGKGLERPDDTDEAAEAADEAAKLEARRKVWGVPSYVSDAELEQAHEEVRMKLLERRQREIMGI